MLRPLYHTASVVVLDSGFCVVKGIIELLKVGVFAVTLLKKRRYWPRYVPCDKIKNRFETKHVGDTYAWSGVLDNTKFLIYCLREPDYVMSMITTYGTLSWGDCQSTVQVLENGDHINFQYWKLLKIATGIGMLLMVTTAKGTLQLVLR